MNSFDSVTKGLSLHLGSSALEDLKRLDKFVSYGMLHEKEFNPVGEIYGIQIMIDETLPEWGYRWVSK